VPRPAILTSFEAFLDRLARFKRSIASTAFWRRPSSWGFAAKPTRAIAALNRAYDNRPFTLSGPSSHEYHGPSVRVAYKATNNTKYRDSALKWAKANQPILPFVAWPYTMESGSRLHRRIGSARSASRFF
jgi:hypothetical protein